MTLVLKSDSKFTGSEIVKGYTDYLNRVEADGGSIFSKTAIIEALLFCSKYNINESNMFSATSINWGYKEVDGNIVKLYSLFNPDGDIQAVSGTFTVDESSGKRGLYRSYTIDHELSTVGRTKSLDLSMSIAIKEDTIYDSAFLAGMTSDPYNAAYMYMRVYKKDPSTITFMRSSLDIVDVTGFQSGGVNVLSHNNVMDVYTAFINGSQGVSFNRSVLTPIPEDGRKMVLGTSFGGYRSTSLVGWIYESWCVEGINDDITQRINTRLSNNYIG